MSAEPLGGRCDGLSCSQCGNEPGQALGTLSGPGELNILLPAMFMLHFVFLKARNLSSE